MGATEIVLVAAVVLIPLAIAVAVTLWTLEPAARRAERAKRTRKVTRSGTASVEEHKEAPVADSGAQESAR